MSRAIVTLIQQSSKILDTVAPKVKEEANKKIAEVIGENEEIVVFSVVLVSASLPTFPNNITLFILINC